VLKTAGICSSLRWKRGTRTPINVYYSDNTIGEHSYDKQRLVLLRRLTNQSLFTIHYYKFYAIFEVHLLIVSFSFMVRVYGES
jgi:hypothetical protein